MLDRVNVAIIVRDHFRTFYNYRDRVLDPRSSSLQKVDIGLNLLIPALIMAVLWCYDVTVPNSSLGTLITALAVFGALLFNLLILVYDVSGRETAGLLPEVARARKKTLLDLHANVAFAVLLALVSIVDLVIAAIGGKGPAVLPTSLAFYYLGALFLLTLLLILRRLHLLLGSDITKG